MQNETLQTIHNRISIKNGFLEKNISSSILEKLIEAGLRAPTASNMQRYSIIVIRDKKRHKKLALYPCNVAIIFCVDSNRWIRIFKTLKKDYPFSGVKELLTSVVDTVLCAENVVLSAQSLGIGSRFTNILFRKNRMKELRQKLTLPKFVFPIISLCLGYPKNNPKERRSRAKIGIVHNETYHDFSEKTIKEIIKEYNNTALRNWGLKEKILNQKKSSNIEFLVKLIQKRPFTEPSRRDLWNDLVESGFFESAYNGF
ncbi:MAG: nitroreductase family protein [Candidatus Heimdallarchaeota archaeon]